MQPPEQLMVNDIATYLMDMDGVLIRGTESGMQTILVLTGVTQRAEVERFPYRPTHVVASVGDIFPLEP